MNKDFGIDKFYSRISIFGIFILLIGSGLCLKLFQRQVFQKAQYSALAEKQYYTRIDQPAKRGSIYIKDRDNVNIIDQEKAGLFPVASNIDLFNVSIIPKHVTNKEETAKKLSEVIGMQRDEIFLKINNSKAYIPPIKKLIPKDEADKISALNLKGVYLESEYGRIYPEKEFLAQVLGFVNREGSGKYGVEEYFDGLLKGEGGRLQGLKDNFGKVIEVQQSEPGKDGASIVLTVDRSIQYMAEKKLKEGVERYKASGGSIVIMDPKTGGILAMASSPSYDPNKFGEVAQIDQSLFLNPALCLNWEPGSIFKPIIVAAATAERKIEPDSKPESPFANFVTVDGYDIHNSQDKSYGYESVSEILENSDNVGMIWIADKLGNESLYNWLKSFGFGVKTGIDVTGEASGKMEDYRKWKNVNRATISFGQGISTTPIQIVSAYSVIANGGYIVKPHLLDQVIEGESKKTIEYKQDKRILSDEDVTKLKQMMISVVENGHGKKAKVEGYKVGGKTGTAQVPKKDGPGYEENEHIGSFAGFAPVDDPRFVMLVKFDKPQTVEWAESSAAPIFGEIADWLLNSYLKVPKV